MQSQDTAPSVYIETYGCQMNVLDSELVRGQLESLGYQFVTEVADADVVLLNTCSVRDLSEQKVWSQLGRLGISKRQRAAGLTIGVLGCMAEREGRAILKRVPDVDILCGPSDLDKLPGLVDNALRNRRLEREQRTPSVSLAGHTARRSSTLAAASDGLETLDLSRAFSPEESRFQAYVRITRGCNKMCSYCVVPFTRGPEVHRPAQHIIDEVKRLAAAGVMEVTLLGQTVNHYAFSEGGKTTSFADLLWQIHESVPELPRLRFLTSYPRDFTDDALDAMAASPRICRYLHIPVQSGSNRILQAMNRGYTIEEYDALLERARSRMPDIRLAGDMIAGFPDETDEEHEASVALLKRARYKSCYVFKYSPRPGTVADRRLEDNVPRDVKKVRNIELLDTQSAISLELHREQIGTQVEVMVEGHGKLRKPTQPSGDVQIGWQKPEKQEARRLIGRTQGDEIVAFDGPAETIGTIASVHITAATHITLIGEHRANPT